jgi:hypothetical protein
VCVCVYVGIEASEAGNAAIPSVERRRKKKPQQ